MGLSKKERRAAKFKSVFEPIDSTFPKNDSIAKVISGNWKQLLLICALSLIVYFNGIKADFVSDDYATIINSQTILSTAYFSDPGVTFTGSAVVNFFVAAVFGKNNPIPFHLTNLFLFELVLLLAFIVVTKIYNEKLAFTATLIFAFLPINVEAVTWISGKPYLLGAISFLASFLAFLKWFKKRNLVNMTILVASVVFACFCFGPRGLVVLLLFLLYWLCFGAKSKSELIKVVTTILSVLAVGVLIFLPMIMTRLSVVAASGGGVWDKFYEPWFQYPTSVTKYLQLILFPIDLTLYHTMLQVIPNWLNWLVLVLYVLTTFYFYLRGNINLAFAMAFVFIVSAGSMTPLKVSWMVAERYMFLGGLGIAIVLALMLENFSEKLNLFKWLLTAILISFFGYRIFLRNINWQTNHNLWVNTCQVSPNSHNAWNNIGDDYDKLKQYENAVKGFTQSTVVKNDYADAYHNRANIFFKINRLDLARDSYLTALKYNPGLYQSYVALIQVAMSENKVEEAFSYGNTLLKYQPNNPLVHYIFGVLYKQIGKSEEAKKAFTKALQIDPNFNQARIQLSSTT